MFIGTWQLPTERVLNHGLQNRGLRRPTPNHVPPHSTCSVTPVLPLDPPRVKCAGCMAEHSSLEGELNPSIQRDMLMVGTQTSLMVYDVEEGALLTGLQLLGG